MKKEKGKNTKGFLKKSVTGVIAGALALTMAVGIMQPAVETYAKETVADLDTTTKYTESLGHNASTEYAGRVWTDKTVYDEDSVTFDAYGDAEYTVANGEDFLVAFSALATSQSISGATQAPVDVVFVVDLSGSMSNQHSSMTINGVTKSRIAFTVEAINEAITTLMRNPYARVAVVGFNEEGDVLLPLERYTQVDASTPYFSLDTTTASKNNARLTVRAVNSQGETISRRDTWYSYNAVAVSGGTNIQDGIFDGMSLLNTTTSTTTTIDGKTVTRMPSMVLLSDGAPTYSMDLTVSNNNARNWWQPDGYQGPGSSAYAGNGMLAMSIGAYMKKQVDAHYGLTNAANKTTIYTIGMDITNIKNNNGNIDSSQVDLAQVVLNPRVYLDTTRDEYKNSNFAQTIMGYWNTYCAATGDKTPILQCNSNSTYEMQHPSTGDIAGNDLKNYVDAYYHANQSDSVLQVFTNIVSTILMNSPEVPTEHDKDAPMSTGHIVYTDPIGEYMEVKDMKAILYGGHKYTAYSKSVDGNKTTYKFTDVAEGNKVYGEEKLEHIRITVESTDAGNDIKKQTMKVEIPASLIPIRVNEVVLNANGTVKTHTNNGAYPIRVLYTVGLQDKVKNDDGTVNMGVLSDEYIENNLNKETGQIEFYSNLYTGRNVVNGNTAGDTTAEFVAAATNPFYYMQENTYILNSNGDKVKTIYDNTTYHYDEKFYIGSEVVEKAITRTGKQLKDNVIIRQDANGEWYRPAGTVRLNRMLTFEGTKNQNATNTAADFYAPTYDSSSRKFKVYLGNNGMLSMEATGALMISKTVTAEEGLTAPDKEFIFTVELNDKNNHALTGSYDYVILDIESNVVLSGTIKDEGKLTLKSGQSAKIYNLPPGTRYTVNESAIEGFTTKVNGINGSIGYGTITAGGVDNVEYENHYDVEPLVYPVEGEKGIVGKKYLAGRSWKDSDSFTFAITSPNGAPLPTGTGIVAETNRSLITISGSNYTNGAEFGFGTIRFEKPGTYRYTLVELTPAMTEAGRIPGISYTREAYEVVIEVADQGEGKLNVTSSVMTKVRDKAGNVLNSPYNATVAEFTNTYSAEATQYGPVAIKKYIDNSGKKPLTDGMFQFTLKAVSGTNENGATVEVSTIPMPAHTEASTGIYTTSNIGIRVSLGQMTFATNDVGHTYWYEIKEVVPTQDVTVNADGTVTKDGMTYDTRTYKVKVMVQEETVEGNAVVKVTPEYYYVQNDGTLTVAPETVATFNNEYNETPIVVGEGVAPIQGTKTLTGRDMKTGEIFTFNLTAADTETIAAINSNAIQFGKQISDATKTLLTATVTGDQVSQIKVGQNGVPAAFLFDKIIFTKQGTYKFNVSEVIPTNANGITYDTHVCTVTVVVEDKIPASTNAGDSEGDSILEAIVTYSDPNGKAEFKNTYKATFDISTAFDLYGTKTLTGRPLYEGDFFFSVEVDGGGRAVPLVSNKADTSDSDGDKVYEGAITFLENQEYTAAGNYVYIIKEQIPSGHVNNVWEGVTYTNVQYRVTVPVVDNLNGRLYVDTDNVIVELSTDGGANYTAVANKNIVFSNSYAAAPDYYVTSQMHKKLTGERDSALAAEEFSFIRKVTYAKTLANEDVWDGIQLLKNKHADGIVDVTVEDSQGIGNDDTKKDIVTNAADGTVTFGDIRFTKKGIYIVEVSEIVPSGATPVYETVQDENNQSEEVLVAYKKNGITYDIQKITRVFRVVDNEEGELIVEVIGLSGAADLTFTNDYDTVGNLSGATNLEVSKQFKGREWTTSDQLIFLLVGHDTVTRTAIANGEIVLPETSNELKHQINGLVANVDHVAAIELDYDDVVQANISGAGTADVITTVNKAFEDITFNLPGTYVFHIREVAGTDTKMTYDTEERIITVTAEDKGDGTIDATVTSVEDKNGADITLTFTNIFEPNDIIVYGRTNLHVTKVLDGRDWTTADAFTFTLEPATDDAHSTGVKNANNVELSTKQVVDAGEIVLESPITITVNSGNKDYVHFGNIRFKEAGTFRFNVKESTPNGETNGMTYDTTTKTVVVNVTYENGVFATTVSGDNLTFTNRYDHGSVDLSGATYLKVNKVLNGRDYENNESFTFNLTPVSNDHSTTGVKDAQNNPMSTADAVDKHVIVMGDSVVELPKDSATPYFGNITFTEPGVYKFAITEQIPSDADKVPGMSYDTHTEIVTVTVADSGLGYLTVSADTPGTGVTFTNTYKASVAELEIPVKKILHGRKIKNGESFEFVISNAVGAPLPSNVRASVLGDGTKDTLSTSFGRITYDKAGTYVYIIYEVAGTAGGVTYDATSYRVTVEVSEKIVDGKHTGALEAKIIKYENRLGTGDVAYVEITDPEKKEVVFNNIYGTTEATYATANLNLKKTLEGKELTAGAFEFTIEAGSNNPAEGMTLPATTTVGNASDGRIDFGTIKFTKAGTYTVKVSENIPNNATEVKNANNEVIAYVHNGITYDIHNFTAIFEVTDDGNGKLVVNVINTSGSEVFENTYSASGILSGETYLKVRKEFTGRENNQWLDSDAFTFVLEPENAVTNAAVTAETVKLPANATGISITKIDAPDYQKAFGNITFTEVGIYKFRIREITGINNAITYDATKRTITVVVTDPNKDGKLDVNVTYDGANSQTSVDIQTYMTFKNHYNPKEAVLYGHDDLRVTKTFTGRKNDEWLDSDAFTFVLEAADNDDTGNKDVNNRAMSTKAAQTANIIKVSNASVTITKNSKDSHFGNIVFHKPGTYTFNVSEQIPDMTNPVYDGNNNIVGYVYNGITYSAAVKTIVVTVTDDNNGNLSLTHTPDPTSLVFVNTYGTSDITYDMSHIIVEKRFLGRDWNDAEFTFALKANDTVTETAINEGKVILPTNADGIIIDKDTTTEQGVVNHKAFFGDITFKAVGNYSFVIEEIVPSDKGNINYSTHKIIVNISVTDNGTGSLIASTATPTSIIGNNIPFINTYTPEPTTVSLQGVKQIDGRNFLDTDEFWFEVAARDGAPLPGVVEVSTNKIAGGEFAFGPITYTKAGTYVYEIKEIVKEQIPGITYDTNTVTATVVVRYDSPTGKFIVDDISYSGANSEKATFTNVYKAGATTVELKALKQVVDDVNGSYVMNAGDFAFKVITSRYNPTSDPIASAIVSNEAGSKTNNISAGTIYLSDAKTEQFTYTEAGTYKYQIFEENTDKADYFKYDESIYTIVVEVVEDQATATLSNVVTVTKDGKNVDMENDGIVFTNVYDPNHAHFIIEGTKELTGADFDDVAEFKFKLEAVTQGAPMPEAGGEIATSGVGGAFRFGQIEYDTAGEYKYKITEVLPDNVITNSDGTKSLNGVTYDTAEYYVTVKVEDKASAPDNTGMMLSPRPIACTITTDCTLADGHSEACDTSCKETVGCILTNGHTEECFVPCELTVGCTLAYGHSGACDTACKETVGCMLLNGHEEECFVPCGKTVDCILSDGHGEECQIPALLMFMNPEKGVCEVTAGCTLEEGHEGECDNLSSEENNEPETTDEVLVNNEGASLKTVIRNLFMVATGTPDENNPTPNNLSSPNYGQLHASISKITKGDTEVSEVKFENKYHSKPVSVTIGVDSEVKKVMSGRQLKDQEFEFELKAVTSGAPTVGNAKNDANGKVQFGSITFTETGTYSYALKEVLPPGAGADPETGKVVLKGVTYDQEEYEVRVVVTEAKDSNGKNTGNLVAYVEYLDGGQSVEEIEFQNIYSVQPTTVEITANKVLNGRNLNASEFEFKIAAQDNAPLPKDANGVDIVTVKNDADGSVKFGTITFTTAGEYKYTIEEVNGTLSRVTYDTAKYDVVINVVDNGEGTFIVDVKYYKGGNEVNVIEFVNTYKEPPKPKDPELEDEPKDKPEIYPAPKQPVQSTGTKTGDSANLAGLFGLLGAAVVGFLGIKTYKRKKQ